MTGAEQVFVLILILNTLTAIGYFICCSVRYGWNAPQRKECWMKTIIMLLCPLIGPLFFLFVWFCYYLLFHQDVDLEDVVFSKERVETHLMADEEQEGNMVPIEEALVVCDKDNLRSLMMNVIRGDVEKSLSSIALALNSEDSETSHYAATVLRDALNEFRQQVQELYIAMNRKEQGWDDYACILVEYMQKILSQGVFQENEQEEFIDQMEQACLLLYEQMYYRLKPTYIQWLCDLLLGVRRYDHMQKWCERSRELYPNELSTYVCYLKYYFTVEKKKEFFEELDRLKHSDIVIDRETLELIRTFS